VNVAGDAATALIVDRRLGMAESTSGYGQRPLETLQRAKEPSLQD